MWIDVEQNTDEWLDLRVGRIGGSAVTGIMANYGKAFGKPAHKRAVQIALEQIRGKSFEDSYTNAHMERGHEQEPIARTLYEDTYFCDVTNGGYFAVDEKTGVSPDGFVGQDGMIEIKCVIDTVHFDTIKRKAYDPAYKWQMFFELKCTGREWVDYVEYCSEFPEGKKLFVDRIYAKDLEYVTWPLLSWFGMIDVRLTEFWKLVAKKKAVIGAI